MTAGASANDALIEASPIDAPRSSRHRPFGSSGYFAGAVTATLLADATSLHF